MNAHPSAHEVSSSLSLSLPSLCTEVTSLSDPIWRTNVSSCLKGSSKPKALQPQRTHASQWNEQVFGWRRNQQSFSPLWSRFRWRIFKGVGFASWVWKDEVDCKLYFVSFFRNLCVRSPTRWPWRTRRFPTSSALSSRAWTTWRYNTLKFSPGSMQRLQVVPCIYSFLWHQANSNRVQEDLESEFTSLHSALDEMKEHMMTRIKQERASRTYELQVAAAMFTFLT